MSLRGFAAGFLTLVSLQAVVSTEGATGRVGGLLDATAGAVTRILDPNVPAFGPTKKESSK